MKKKIQILLFIVINWISISVMVQSFFCTKMTETELFLNIPNSIILDFKKCN